MHRLGAVAILLLQVLLFANGAIDSDLIKSLPGLPKMPPFKQYSGYLKATQGRMLHYWWVVTHIYYVIDVYHLICITKRELYRCDLIYCSIVIYARSDCHILCWSHHNQGEVKASWRNNDGVMFTASKLRQNNIRMLFGWTHDDL